MPDLFTPLSLRETTLPNRVMVSPMCQYSCEERDGLATDWHLVHLGSRAAGGAGVVMSEATAVSPEGRIAPEDLGLWSQAHADALRPVTEFVRGQGSVPAIQLAHAGRKGSKTRPWEGSKPLQPDEGGWETLAPSAIPYPYDDDPPATRAMDRDDVEMVVRQFVEATELALDAGFEIVEVHAAHGYLLHEFLSPVSNDRDDEYGGDFEGRTRLVREVTEAVREVWPAEKPLFVRISATDWLPDRDSWTLDQSVRLVGDLADLGVDLVDVSAGAVHPDQQIPNVGPGYQVPLAEAIREEYGRSEGRGPSNDRTQSGGDVAVGAVGGISTPEHADSIVRNGRADLAIIGREHLRDPYFSLRAAEKLGAEDGPEWPVQYRRAVE